MTSPIASKQLTPQKQLTPRKTPLQSRPYLSAMARGIHYHSPHYVSANNIHSPHIYEGTNSVHMMGQAKSQKSYQSDIIYGTTISTRNVYSLLQRFITQFQTVTSSSNQMVESQKIYLTQLNEIDLFQTNIFSIQAVHLKEYDIELYLQFIYFPAQMIMCFDQIIKRLYQKRFMTQELDPQQLLRKQNKRDRLMVGITHLGEIKIMRNINQRQINRLISFRGIVVRTSDIIPQMKRSTFKCMKCNDQIRIPLQNARVQEPKSCVKCFAKNSYQIIHNLCQFTDKQFIKFQELPQYVPEGQTPHAVSVIAYDYNVDGVRPGDRVQVVGIYRVQQQRVTKSRIQTISVYKTHLDLISWRIVDQDRLKGSYGQNIPMFNDNDRQSFIKMARNKNIINNLVQSFAPSIHGNTSIKKGILAQLFGGTKKQLPQLGRGRFRSDINICLVGDPSTAKSQLLKQVHNIAIRGVYTSGRGSSAVGLTAHVKRDPQTKEFILQSGALVLSDLGICCIDQFDKMDDNNKTILLQGMQQQTISIAKAGIVCQLNCRSSIISAANPVHSKYNPKKSVIQNINLPPALLTRFDLIYIMLDQPKEAIDKQIAYHILDMYTSNDPQVQRSKIKKRGIYPKELLTKYITYAREYIHPTLSSQAGDRLVEAYTSMRKMGANRKTITATPRQLQSMIRLSQAFAKMKLSSIVSVQDVEEALQLIQIAMQQAATDPNTGLIDMDVIVTGKTFASKQKVSNIVEKIKQIVNANVSKYKKRNNFDSIFDELQNYFSYRKSQRTPESERITQKQVLEALRILQTDGIIVIFGNDKYKPNFKLAKDMN